MFTLTQEEKQEFILFVEASDNLSLRSKNIFTIAFNILAKYNNDKEVLKEFNKILASILNDNTRNRAKNIIKLASEYRKLDMFSKFDLLYMNTLEDMIKLIKYIKENESKDTCKIKLELANKMITDVYKERKEWDTTSYNNRVNEVVREIKSANKIVEVDGKFKYDYFKSNIAKDIAKLKYKELQEIAKLIEEEINKRDEEENKEEVA